MSGALSSRFDASDAALLFRGLLVPGGTPVVLNRGSAGGNVRRNTGVGVLQHEQEAPPCSRLLYAILPDCQRPALTVCQTGSSPWSREEVSDRPSRALSAGTPGGPDTLAGPAWSSRPSEYAVPDNGSGS